MRRSLTLFLLFAILLVTVRSRAAQSHYVVLVTGDGIRHQELFTGVDEQLVTSSNKPSSGIEDPAAFKERYWANDPYTRRKRVMPFFWNTLAKEGVIYGNRSLSNNVIVSNPHHFSYPGYAEILNGQPLAEITSNDAIWSPRMTALEFIQRELQLDYTQVAVFGSWKIFNWIVMQREGGFFCNAGYQQMPEKFLTTPSSRFWNDAQTKVLSPWDSVRHDAITLNLALDYMRAQKPRVVYLALGETDDWAHDRRYDRTIQSLTIFNDALRDLWTMLQTTEPYRGRTTVIVTTDHGRGRTLKDWTSHNKDTPGSDESWLAIFGPDIPKIGEARGGETISASNIAATMLTLLGLDPAKFNPSAAPALKFK